MGRFARRLGFLVAGGLLAVLAATFLMVDPSLADSAPDFVDLRMTGGLSYDNERFLSGGEISIGSNAITGTGQFTGMNGGTASVTFSLSRNQVLNNWSGYITVVDSGKGLNRKTNIAGATIPITAGAVGAHPNSRLSLIETRDVCSLKVAIAGVLLVER